MWIELLTVGSPLFWLVISVTAIIEFLFVFNKCFWWSLTTVVLFILGIVLFTAFNIKAFILYSWQSILWMLLSYVVVGIAWAIVRWILYANKRKAFYFDCKKRWNESANLRDGDRLQSNIEKGFFIEFSHVWNHSEYVVDDPSCYLHAGGGALEIFNAIVPKVSKEKERIATWLSFWPFDILSYLLDDLVVDFYRFLTRAVGRIINRINDAMFYGVKKDLGI